VTNKKEVIALRDHPTREYAKRDRLEEEVGEETHQQKKKKRKDPPVKGGWDASKLKKLNGILLTGKTGWDRGGNGRKRGKTRSRKRERIENDLLTQA